MVSGQLNGVDARRRWRGRPIVQIVIHPRRKTPRPARVTAWTLILSGVIVEQESQIAQQKDLENLTSQREIAVSVRNFQKALR